jgi:glucose-1-phosphate adenylyltransferase
VVVGQGAIVGDGPYDGAPNRQEPARLNTGITVVGKQSIVPRGARVGRNVKIGEGVKNSDYGSRVVRTGGSVDPKPSSRTRAVELPSEPEAASAV